MGKVKKKGKKEKKEKKKKEKIPWYLQEEMMEKEAQEARKKEEAEEAQRKLKEEEEWFNSLSPEEREKVEVTRAAEAKKKEWKDKLIKQQEEEEEKKRKEWERQELNKRRQEEREERKKMAAEGQLEIKGDILLQKCVTCNLTAYSNEQIVVGKDVFHKIGCFRCIFCSTPLKLWNYKKLDGRYYCKAHYEQFSAKILNKNLQALNQERNLEQQKKWEEQKKEEERQRQLELQAQKEREEEEKNAGEREKEEEYKKLERKREGEVARRKIAEMMGEDAGPTPAWFNESDPIKALTMLNDGILPDCFREKEKPTSVDASDSSKKPPAAGRAKAAAPTPTPTPPAANLIKTSMGVAWRGRQGVAKETPTTTPQQLNQSGESSDSDSDSGSTDSDSDSDEEKTAEQIEIDELLFAAERGQLEVVKEKLSSGKIPVDATNDEGETALHMAAQSTEPKLVEYLFQKGADPSKRSATNSTPLHLACNSDHGDKEKEETEIVRLLTEHLKANVDDLDMNYNTPLILASSKGKVETVRLLLKKGAKVRPKNNLGATCLHAAADSGQVGVAKQLINVEAMDYDMQDDQGYTPLHLAVMGNHVKMVQLLLALGASSSIRDKVHGMTSLDEAKTEEMKKTFEMLSKGSGAPKSAASPRVERVDKSPKPAPRDAKDSKDKPSGFMTNLFGKKDKKKEPQSSNLGSSSTGVVADPGVSKEKEERRKREEEQRKEEENRKREAEDRQIQEARQREDDRRREEVQKKAEDERQKEEKKRQTEEKKRQKEEKERRREEERKRKEEEQRRLDEIKRQEEEARKEEERKAKLEAQKKAKEVMSKLKVTEGPTFLNKEEQSTPKQTSAPGKVAQPAFLSVDDTDASPSSKSPREVGKIKTPTFLQDDAEPQAVSSPSASTKPIGKIKTPLFLDTSSDADAPIPNTQPSPTNVGKVRKPAFLENQDDDSSNGGAQARGAEPSKAKAVGKVKTPAFMQPNTPNAAGAPKPPGAPKSAPGKIKKPAFLEQADKDSMVAPTPGKKPAASMGAVGAAAKRFGAAAATTTTPSLGFKKKKQEEEEEEYEYEEEGGEDEEYEYEYEYEDE